MTYTLHAEGVDRVVIELEDGRSVELEALGGDLFRHTFTPDEFLNGYHEGDFHTLLGRRVEHSGTLTGTGPLTGMVRHAAVPDVAVVSLGPDAQASAHVLNLRHDADQLPDIPAVAKSAYQHLGDDFDFMAFVYHREFFANRHFRGVSNDIEGLGLPAFDLTSSFGSAGRLQGTVSYPNPTYFDGASETFSHEVGHRWGVFIEHPEIDANLPARGGHWPASTMAQGVMGWESISNAQGLAFPLLRQVAGGVFEVLHGRYGNTYHPLDLYLMGLVGPDDVGTQYVFSPHAAWEALGRTSPYLASAKPITMEEIVALNGERDPPAGAAPTDFRMAVVVLSEERLLSASEMAYYDAVSARAEGTEEVWVVEGFSRSLDAPFALATGLRATMDVTLPGFAHLAQESPTAAGMDEEATAVDGGQGGPGPSPAGRPSPSGSPSAAAREDGGSADARGDGGGTKESPAGPLAGFLAFVAVALARRRAGPWR
jgi:hypothetical protein